MADIAAEGKVTDATIEKEVEKIEKPEVEKEKVEEKHVENGNADQEEHKENGSVEVVEEKESETKENGRLSEDATEAVPLKRKSEGGGGDAPDGAVAEGASPQKKPKLDETPAENGEVESVA